MPQYRVSWTAGNTYERSWEEHVDFTDPDRAMLYAAEMVAKQSLGGEVCDVVVMEYTLLDEPPDDMVDAAIAKEIAARAEARKTMQDAEARVDKAVIDRIAAKYGWKVTVEM